MESEESVQPEFGIPQDALAELMPNAISIAANSFPQARGSGQTTYRPELSAGCRQRPNWHLRPSSWVSRQVVAGARPSI